MHLLSAFLILVPFSITSFTYFFLHYTFLCSMVTDHGVTPCWVCGWQKEVDSGMELP